MRISAKFNEICQTEILLHTAAVYQIKEIIEDHKDSIAHIEVKRCRKTKNTHPNRSQEDWERFQSLNQHKVILVFKSVLPHISIRISSHRINAEDVLSMGLTPDPIAYSKEKSVQMMEKLDGQN